MPVGCKSLQASPCLPSYPALAASDPKTKCPDSTRICGRPSSFPCEQPGISAGSKEVSTMAGLDYPPSLPVKEGKTLNSLDHGVTPSSTPRVLPSQRDQHGRWQKVQSSSAAQTQLLLELYEPASAPDPPPTLPPLFFSSSSFLVCPPSSPWDLVVLLLCSTPSLSTPSLALRDWSSLGRLPTQKHLAALALPVAIASLLPSLSLHRQSACPSAHTCVVTMKVCLFLLFVPKKKSRGLPPADHARAVAPAHSCRLGAALQGRPRQCSGGLRAE